jgi:small subunit ribosomal protein S3
MGQKIHPTGFRLAVSRNWASRWYASNRDFAGMLAEDIKARVPEGQAEERRRVARPDRASAKNARITIFSGSSGRGDRQEG